MKKLKTVFRVLHSDPWWEKDSKVYRRDGVASLLLGMAAGIMLILNLRSGAKTMAVCSVILVVGFLVSFLAAIITKNARVSKVLIAGLVCFVLSVFAITGGNHGFAILWILLVPFFSVSLLGQSAGLALSTYFVVFLFLLFYSPLNGLILDKYPETYLHRFPVLYTADYLISMFIAFQAEYYYRSAHIQSYTDELTNLYNRRFFISRLKEVDARQMSVMILDLNGLKMVNDQMGHEAGDQLICAMADCCRSVLPEDAILARIGGDEFAVLLFGSADEAEQMKCALLEKAAHWKRVPEGKLSFAVGLACSEQHPEMSVPELFREADSAMYRNKAAYYGHTGEYRRTNNIT